MYSVLPRLILLFLETRILIAGIPDDGHALTSPEACESHSTISIHASHLENFAALTDQNKVETML
jgi:hypothetical protein